MGWLAVCLLVAFAVLQVSAGFIPIWQLPFAQF